MAVLETPATYGAEHLLAREALEWSAKLISIRIPWREDHTRNRGDEYNLFPGNKAGGLTTILEKSPAWLCEKADDAARRRGALRGRNDAH